MEWLAKQGYDPVYGARRVGTGVEEEGVWGGTCRVVTKSAKIVGRPPRLGDKSWAARFGGRWSGWPSRATTLCVARGGPTLKGGRDICGRNTMS